MWLLSLLVLVEPHLLHSSRGLAQKIDTVLDRPAMSDSFWGIVVYAPLRQKVLYQRLPHKNFRPASNMKILTTLLGLEYLGPDYQFQTAIYANGLMDWDTGILKGDLVIKGRGDPSISGNYAGDALSTEALIQPVLASLAKRGLREIRGNLVAVTGYFDDVQIQKSWEWDDLGTSYGTPVTALSLHDAWINVGLFSDQDGKAHFTHYPAWISDIEIEFDTLANGSALDLEIERDWGSNRLRVSGQFPPCSQRNITISAWDPTHHFLETLRGMLAKEGIQTRGGLRQQEHMPAQDLRLLETLNSPSLATLSRTLMQDSQNHYADCVLKTVGKEVLGDGSFEAGAEVAEQFLRTVLADLKEPQPSLMGIHIRDGSGLSAQNYLRPSYLVDLLRYGLSQPYREAWLATFPIMGRDGTLSRRGLENSPAVGRIWAKTGYIYRTRTLSGYALTLAGEPLVFSLMANNYSAMTAEINRTQDHICDLLVRLKPNRKARKYLAKKGPALLPKYK